MALAAISILYRFVVHCGGLYLLLNVFMAAKTQCVLHLVEKSGIWSAVCIMAFGAGLLYRFMYILSTHLILYEFMAQEAQVIARFH